MEQTQYNQLFSFIWNIATDVLVYAFEKGDYKKIIMPMMVLRRIDVLLEPTKERLLSQKKILDDNHINNQDPILYNVTGYPFYNASLFTMRTLKSETDPLRLKINFIDYLNGFSKDVQDIIDKFHLRQMVDNLTEAERLGSIIEKFTDDKINLSNKPVLDDEGNIKLPSSTATALRRAMNSRSRNTSISRSNCAPSRKSAWIFEASKSAQTDCWTKYLGLKAESPKSSRRD